MLDLCAIIGRAAETATGGTIHRKLTKEVRLPGVFMAVEGEHSVDNQFYDDSQVTLICRADLLVPDPVTNVAAYLGRLYCEQGDGFVTALRGTFAIILYDQKERKLKAWSDHFGAERLVYADLDGALAVSTNIGWAAKAHGRQPAIRETAIQEYLQYTCIPAPKTIYKGVSKLAPGHQLNSGSPLVTRCYWDLSYDEPSPRFAPLLQKDRDLAEWVEGTRDGVRVAVEKSLQNLRGAEREGCFLSGGTDSSSVAGFVGRLTAKPPRTFSIGFDDPRYNEIQYARIAAKHFSADHHEYFVTPDDIPDLVQKAVQVYDEPFGNSSIVPTYYCARLAAEHGITHLLAGDGGDELFGGNSRYADDQVFQSYSRIPHWMRKWVVEPIVSTAAGWTNLRLLNLAASYTRRANIPAPDRYFSYSWVQDLPAGEVFAGDLLAAVRNEDPTAIARSHFRSARAHSDLNRWLYMDLKITIADNDLRKVMTMSRLAGITPRFPFLNPTLAEFTGKIPSRLKVRGTQLRYLFKKAMSTVLPEEIIKKQKHGFGLPYSVWLGDSKPLREFTFDALASARFRDRGYFRPGLFDWLWSQYQSVHRGYYGEILWTLLILELWHIVHVDTRTAEDRRALAALNLN